jgi:serine/threonine protein kinase
MHAHVFRFRVLSPHTASTTTIFTIISFIRTAMIGQGAYGIVYKGKKEDTGDIVAIKRIPFSDSTPEGGVPCNVIREISLLRELDHPNVVSYLFVLEARIFPITGFVLRERCYQDLAKIKRHAINNMNVLSITGPTLGYHPGTPRRPVFGV